MYENKGIVQQGLEEKVGVLDSCIYLHVKVDKNIVKKSHEIGRWQSEGAKNKAAFRSK